MRQGTLFDERERTIRERYERWRGEHPDVYQEFVRIALDLRRRGFERYSADGIGHVLRWFVATSGKDDEGWKINNCFISRMAREAMDNHQELRTFFEVRRLKSE